MWQLRDKEEEEERERSEERKGAVRRRGGYRGIIGALTTGAAEEEGQPSTMESVWEGNKSAAPDDRITSSLVVFRARLHCYCFLHHDEVVTALVVAATVPDLFPATTHARS